ncbi:MAG: MurT ligase domain-containing protein [Slackia sp.]|nr:MurT ligase domain-containing protein [Slackia sp.]
MGFRSQVAATLGKSARWAGETFMHRSAGNLPGAIAMKLAPAVLADLAPRADNMIVVSGTNGKTTTTNLVADCLATSGRALYCNRDGNNLESGIVTALLVKPEQGCSVSGAASSSGAPVSCFECDEMYTKHVLPRVRPRYFMLLNLFRDQLDRVGEIEHVQNTIAAALEGSPETVFLYNGDDPLCAAIAGRIPNRSTAFGIASDLGLDADRISDSRFCQQCGAALEYDYVHYGQLGAYRCPDCGWARPALDFAACNVRLEDDGYAFDIDGHTVCTGQTGAYMIYNTLAAYAASKVSGIVAFDDFARAVESYRPTNGRLQTFDLGTRSVMTNLAKNPTGFNQNIRIVLNEGGRVLALFVNDDEADGCDVSWFWDIDFERWAQIDGLKAFVGGTRANDMQVRLKYAGIESTIVETAADVLDATDESDGKVYVIANYTALPPLRRELELREEGLKAFLNASAAEGFVEDEAGDQAAVKKGE